MNNIYTYLLQVVWILFFTFLLRLGYHAVIFSLPAFLNLRFVPNRMGSLVYYQRAIHIGYWNHCSSVFQFRRHVYVQRQGKSYQRIVIDLITQLASYHWHISEKAKGQVLTREAHHTNFSRCLNAYF